MRLLICAVLLACAAADGEPLRSPRDGVAPSGPAAQSPSRRAARGRAGHTPRHVKRRKGSPMTNKPVAPTGSPVLDGPNRMEIDPADIPPSERPRDPNVDDRTRIPSEVSPDDMAPVARKPKKRRP